MGHKHDYLNLEAFCNFHNVVVVAAAAAAAADDADADADADADCAAVPAVSVAVAVAVGAAAAVDDVAVAAAVEEACPVLDRRLEYLGPLVPRLEEIFFGRSLSYVDHEVAK